MIITEVYRTRPEIDELDRLRLGQAFHFRGRQLWLQSLDRDTEQVTLRGWDPHGGRPVRFEWQESDG